MRFASALASVLLVACATPTDEVDTDPLVSTSDSTSSGETAGDTTTAEPESSSGVGASTSDADTSDSEHTTTETTASDSSTGAPSCSRAPDAAQPWIEAYVDDIVARLSGATELVPGLTLPERSTATHRAATADWLEAEFENLGLEVERHAYAAEGTNIVGRLRATEPGGRTLVVGAHFDSVPGSPGANDNATGVAYVLSLARYLGSVECRSHDVLFVGFDQEEIGLVGSDAYAAYLVDQGEDVISVHTIDQMGWDQDGDRAIELERADEGLFDLYEAANASLDTPLPLHSTMTGFTDHVSFRAYGFEAVGLTEEFVNGDTTPHYHLASDTYDTVNLGLLVSTCVLGHTAFAMLIDAA